ncbi:innexin inx2 [Tetranychus urticae]|uniref:Innexin n=1 Tax=Tetranychus urticae TaxID=32264 RepID=T1L390_TETUR|nr:innexin inx2 [Tetranychus urticae]
MDGLFRGLSKLVKITPVTNDDIVFRLHRQLTVLILFAFSIIVTARQYIGDPIDCLTKTEIPSDLLDTYCWIHTTFSIESAWNKTIGVEVPYPGVAKQTKDDTRVHHHYYQWVCFFLFIQALLFYFPRFLWKSFEARRLNSIVMDLHSPILSNEERTRQISIFVKYYIAHLGYNGIFTFQYYLCQILCFVNVICQMWLTDWFLGGEFTQYGWKVWLFTDETDPGLRFDPMVKVFPTITKCIFYKYGHSGDIEKFDTICILIVNILNQKLYFFLWNWFWFLSVITGAWLIYRFLLVFWPQTRSLVTRGRSKMIRNDDELKTVLRSISFADWFVLDFVAINVDSMNFKEIIGELAKHFKPKGNKGNQKTID